MISIITAIYNQRAVNEIFWENLRNYTFYPFELIVIDNGSSDGSAEFFDAVGARVIKNGCNYSYPHSQNQGIALAQYDWLFFLNNDIIVSPGWDAKMINNMAINALDVATCCGIEQVENQDATRRIKRRWQRIKGLIGLFGYTKKTLLLMHHWMYGDWEKFTLVRNRLFESQAKEGFVGNTVAMKKSVIGKIGLWDERIQGADFDLYLRTKARAKQVGDMKPVHICLDVFNHHYIRLTAKRKYPRFADFDSLINLEDKWTSDELLALRSLNQ